MKKKLRLQIEKLHVEQFDVQPDSPAARGTVHGMRSGDSDCIGGSGCRICLDVPETYWSCPDTSCCGI